jgi:hypothetical protein
MYTPSLNTKNYQHHIHVDEGYFCVVLCNVPTIDNYPTDTQVSHRRGQPPSKRPAFQKKKFRIYRLDVRTLPHQVPNISMSIDQTHRPQSSLIRHLARPASQNLSLIPPSRHRRRRGLLQQFQIYICPQPLVQRRPRFLNRSNTPPIPLIEPNFQMHRHSLSNKSPIPRIPQIHSTFMLTSKQLQGKGNMF